MSEEVDELKARLAEVTAERDECREKHNRLRDDYMDLLDGANKTGMDLAHLLHAVESYRDGSVDALAHALLEENLFNLAAKIRKERS